MNSYCVKILVPALFACLILIATLYSISADAHSVGRTHSHHEGFGNQHSKHDSKDKHTHKVILGTGPDIIAAYAKAGVLYLIMGKLKNKCYK